MFADFYAELYRGAGTEHSFLTRDVDTGTSGIQVSAEELRAQLITMANGKCADTRGIVAELLKHASDNMLDNIATIFSDILKVGAATPEYWKESRLKILFKRGDARKPDN